MSDIVLVQGNNQLNVAMVPVEAPPLYTVPPDHSPFGEQIISVDYPLIVPTGTDVVFNVALRLHQEERFVYQFRLNIAFVDILPYGGKVIASPEIASLLLFNTWPMNSEPPAILLDHTGVYQFSMTKFLGWHKGWAEGNYKPGTYQVFATLTASEFWIDEFGHGQSESRFLCQIRVGQITITG